MITSWTEAWAHLRTLDGEEWDKESERLDEEWRASYRAEFGRFAAGRPGWTHFDAETWARELVDNALMACHSSASPEEAAQTDVLECENQSAA